MAPPRVKSTGTPRGINRPGYSTPKPVNVSQMMNQPMSAGMSMAMAGNTGLAGLSENQANQIKQGQQALNQFKGNTTEPVTFQTIGQQFGEIGSKYRRPADKARYADRMRMLNQGIAAGGKFFVGPDGVPRFSFMGGDTIVRDASGKQLLSMLLPEMTASAPTLGQLGGDISRAFTGYDSLKYPDQNFQGPFPVSQNRNMPYMESTPGMMSGISPLSFIPGAGLAMKAVDIGKSLFDKGIGLFKGESQFDKPQASGSIPDSGERSISGLSPLQLQVYNAVIQIPGKTHSEALAAAQRQNFANGGIATLN